MKLIIYILSFFLLFLSCQSNNESNKNEVHLKSKDRMPVQNKKLYVPIVQSSDSINSFSDLTNLKTVKSNTGKTLPFSMTYEKSNLKIDNIDFYYVTMMLISDNYMNIDFNIGIKKDKLYGLNIFSKPENILSFNNNKFPRKLPTSFLYPRELILDSVYSLNGEKIFRLNSFYASNGQNSQYTIENIYISKNKAIFKIDVIDNNTKIIYSAGNSYNDVH